MAEKETGRPYSKEEATAYEKEYKKAGKLWKSAREEEVSAEVYEKKGQVEKAAEAYEKAANLYENAAEFFRKYGGPKGADSFSQSVAEMYEKAGKPEKAAEARKKLSKPGGVSNILPGEWEMAERAARASEKYAGKFGGLSSKGKGSNAAKAYEKAAEMYEKAGKPEKAAEAYEKAAEAYEKGRAGSKIQDEIIRLPRGMGVTLEDPAVPRGSIKRKK